MLIWIYYIEVFIGFSALSSPGSDSALFAIAPIAKPSQEYGKVSARVGQNALQHPTCTMLAWKNNQTPIKKRRCYVKGYSFG
jgi:hypothetical protein